MAVIKRPSKRDDLIRLQQFCERKMKHQTSLRVKHVQDPLRAIQPLVYPLMHNIEGAANCFLLEDSFVGQKNPVDRFGAVLFGELELINRQDWLQALLQGLSSLLAGRSLRDQKPRALSMFHLA
ncbi:hypothetical protein D5400_04475 [Georhizobium profundi]|uniref:Uncharacterized protein n=1 Tax=Georhizobium profundi TaxID=2341112 RepID=A0A3Q8XLZ9_9HYPH|nr:hypothetical protein D5400_04475 [Georhizobium profundi]